MKKRYLFLLFMGGIVLMNACQKEHSFENGTGASAGTLQDDGSGDCLPKTVAGAYVAGTALAGTTNYIEVQVNVTQTGTYTVYTDTVNGMYFRATGVFTSTGLFTVQLNGNGTPVAPGIHNFIVRYGNSNCAVSVTTSGNLATFTLDGAPGGCMGASVAGTYAMGVNLNATNTVTINVDVTTIGAYTISSTPSNGMTFVSSGTFTTTGPQAIVLTGTGTPAAGGSTNIPITAGSSTCSFMVDVTGSAAFGINCGATVVNGTYTAGVALGASNTVTISVDVTAIGAYNFTTTAANGMTFMASGTFTATGTQTVTLAGQGMPDTAGTTTVSLASASCTFPVTVAPGAGAAAYTITCGTAVVNGTYAAGVALTAANTVAVTVNVTTVGTYTISTVANNSMTFSVTGTFTATGSQTVTLVGSGTPAAGGTFTIAFTTGTCTFQVTVTGAAVSDYYPRTANSNWSYEFDGDPNDSLLIRAKTGTVTIGPNVYNEFEWTEDASMGFGLYGRFRKSGGDYSAYRDMGAYFGFDNTINMDYIFLKDNVAAGTSWQTATINGVSGTDNYQVRIVFTVEQKDVTVIVKGVSYPNTIVIREKYELFVGGVWIDVTNLQGYYKTYYSRNVGMIKEDGYYEAGNANPPLDYEQNLRRYQVF